MLDGTVYLGSRDTNLYALDAADGSERWRYGMESEPSSPAIVDETVYVTTGDGSVLALQER